MQCYNKMYGDARYCDKNLLKESRQVPISNIRKNVKTHAMIQTEILERDPPRSSTHCLDSEYISRLLDGLENVDAATFIIDKCEDQSAATFADVFSVGLSLIKRLE